MTSSFFNETLYILLIVTAVTILFNRVIAHTAWSITVQHNPDTYERGIKHILWLESIRDTVTGERIQWRHG